MRARGWLGALLLAASACGTIDTRRDSTYEGERIYSGTRQDLRGLGVGFLNLNPLVLLIYLVDLPLSALADTALLPWSIPEESRRLEDSLERQRLDRDVPSPVPTRSGETPLAHARRLFERCKQLYEELSPRVTDCYAIDATLVSASGERRTGAAFKEQLRASFSSSGGLAWVTYQSPRYTEQGDRVLVEAERPSSFSGHRPKVRLLIGRGDDGYWRILEETGIDWP
jgi:uncharacterized protein YceK